MLLEYHSTNGRYLAGMGCELVFTNPAVSTPLVVHERSSVNDRQLGVRFNSK